MKKLLFISSRPIFPIIGGDQIRTFQSLRLLTKYFNIHLIIITPTDISKERMAEYEKYGTCRYCQRENILCLQ